MDTCDQCYAKEDNLNRFKDLRLCDECFGHITDDQEQML